MSTTNPVDDFLEGFKEQPLLPQANYSKCPRCGYWAFDGVKCYDCGYRRRSCDDLAQVSTNAADVKDV